MDKPKVFVAYPYSFSKADYRRVFRDLGKAYGVEFTYADQKITNKQILEKIEAMIREAQFSVFDVSTWNANVSWELGIAIGGELDYYILFNPTIEQQDVPADLGGIDRIQYRDYASLGEGVSNLLTQQFGPPLKDRDAKTKERAAAVTEHLDAISEEIPDLVKREPGLAIGGIASSIGVPIDLAKTLVRPLVDGGKIRLEGVKRGAKYYPPEQ
jgi:hypothetical protein